MTDQSALIQIYEDSEQLSQVLADEWKVLAQAAQQDHGCFHVALAGGSTPKKLYETLATQAYIDTIDWQHIHVYFGDERPVAADHVDSNFRMASQAFLDKIDIPQENIHRIEIDVDDLDATANRYQQTLINHLPLSDQQIPCFDLILLGLGPDGHIASLFPETPALDETSQFVVSVFVEKFQTTRISITYPIINNATNIVMLVAGENKADIMYDIMNPSQDRPLYPVERIKPLGTQRWFLDTKAAQNLTLGTADAYSGC